MNPLDEVPISGCGQYNWDAELPAEEETAQTTGPLETRLTASLWKTKIQALRDFQDLTGNAASEHLPAVLNLLKEANLSVCEAALQAVLVLSKDRVELLQPYLEQVVAWVTEKGATSSKAAIKTAACELVLELYEKLMDVGPVLATMRTALDHKNQKVQAAAISLLAAILRTFGHTQYPIMEVATAAGRLAGSTVPQVRTEALAFLQEAHRWNPSAVLPLLDSLKKSQSDELRSAFQSQMLPAVPLRFPKRPISTAQPAASVRSIERPPAKDIFDKYDDAWAEEVTALEKWTQKKEALEELNREIENGPLAERSPSALVTLVKRALKDSNLQVNLQAVRLAGLLAKGQGGYFEPFARQLVPALLLKLKDKKLVAEVQTALHRFSAFIKLPTMAEDFAVIFNDKLPAAKVQLLEVISQEATSQPEREVRAIWACYASTLKTLMEDTSEEVRKAAVTLTAGLLSKAGEAIGPALTGLPTSKVKEVQEAGGLKPAVKAPAAKPAEVRLKPTTTAAVAKKPLALSEPAEAPAVPDESIAEQMATLLPEEMRRGLENTAWKEKQSGFLALTAWLRENSQVAQGQIGSVVRYIALKCRDWKENNLNVIKSALETIEAIASDFALDWRTTELILTQAILSKLGDPKLTDILSRICQQFCEKTSPRKVATVLTRDTQDTPKPKQISETCDLLLRILDDFGPHRLDISGLLTYARKLLGEANPVIRKAGHGMVLGVYKHTGENVVTQLGALSKHILDALAEDLKKVVVIAGATYRDAPGEEQAKAVDRVNISGKLTRALLSKMNSADWKERKEALDALETILNDVRSGLSASGLSDLVQMVRLRLSDNNKTLQRGYLALTGRLADLLGPEGRPFSKSLLTAVLTCLTDKQPQTRTLAIQTVDKWSKVAETDAIVALCGQALAQENAELRLELLQWLVSFKEQLRKSSVQGLVAPILACLQDRVLPIRNASELVLAEIIDYMPSEVLESALTDLKPTIVTTLLPILNKYRKSEPKKAVLKPALRLEDKRNAYNPLPMTSWLAQAYEEKLASFISEATAVLPLDSASRFIDLSGGVNAAAALVKQLVKTTGTYSYHSLILKWLHLLWTQRVKVDISLLRQVLEPLIGLYTEAHSSLMDVDVSVLAPFLAIDTLPADNSVLETLVEGLNRICVPCTLFNQIVSSLIVEIHMGYQGVGWARPLAVKAAQTIQPGLDSRALAGLYEIAPTIGREIIQITFAATGDRFWSLFGSMKDGERATFMQILNPGRSPVAVKTRKSVTFALPSASIPSPVLDLLATMQEGSLSEKVDALTALCEIVTQPESSDFHILLKQLSALIQAFDNLFKGMYKAQTIPFTFAKFAARVLAKMCGEPKLAATLSVLDLEILAELFLKGLLHEQVQGANTSPDSIGSILNLSFVLLMENSNPTSMYQALFRQIRRYSTELAHPRMVPTLVKCILKMTKALEALLPRLDIGQLLLSMHELLEAVPRPASFSGDDSVAKTIKTVISELVRLRKAALWEDYSTIKTRILDDQNIARWIGTFMSSQGIDAGSVYQRVRSPLKARRSSNDPVNSLFERIKSEEQYPEAAKELQDYIQKNPECDISDQLKTCNEELAKRITTDIQRPKPKIEPDHRGESSALRSRMDLIKARFGLQSLQTNIEGTENQATGTPKTSMLSLKQKWEHLKASKSMLP